MRMFRPLLFLIFLVSAFVLNSYEDTLVHHYDISIFASLGHDSYWYPDWTRKYENTETLERKGFWIFQYPAFFYDGWHLIKVFRYLAMVHALIFLYLSADINYKLKFWSYVKFVVIFMVAHAMIHWLFYNNLLLNK